MERWILYMVVSGGYCYIGFKFSLKYVFAPGCVWVLVWCQNAWFGSKFFIMNLCFDLVALKFAFRV
jgi:hypothetical protein